MQRGSVGIFDRHSFKVVFVCQFEALGAREMCTRCRRSVERVLEEPGAFTFEQLVINLTRLCLERRGLEAWLH